MNDQISNNCGDEGGQQYPLQVVQQRFVNTDGIRIDEYLTVSVRHSDDEVSAHRFIRSWNPKHVKSGSSHGLLGEEQRAEVDLE